MENNSSSSAPIFNSLGDIGRASGVISQMTAYVLVVVVLGAIVFSMLGKETNNKILGVSMPSFLGKTGGLCLMACFAAVVVTISRKTRVWTARSTAAATCCGVMAILGAFSTQLYKK